MMFSVLFKTSIFLAAGFLVVSGIIHSLRIWRVSLYFKSIRQRLSNEAPAESEYPDIFLLVPLLRESDVLDGMFSWLSELRYPAEKLKIVLITTEREYETGRVATSDTVAEVQSRVRDLMALGNQKFLHLHYPYTQGVKSNQLNFALRKLRDLIPARFNDKTYIGIYDADSITPPDVLDILARQAIYERYQNIYQQPTWYFKNHNRLPSSIAGQLAASFAWLQSAFALYHEAYLLIRQADKKVLTKMEYGVGHGLFVRWPFLEMVGLFPSPIEDVRLGHIASYLGEKLHLLPVFDTAEVAVGIRRQIQQSSVWFTGEAFVAEDLRIARRISPVPVVHALRLLSYKLYRNAAWICRPFFLATAALVTAYTGNVAAAILVLLIYLYLPLLTLWVLNVRFRHFAAIQQRTERMSPSVCALGLAPAEFLIMSLGPLLGLIRFTEFRLKLGRLNLAKTER